MAITVITTVSKNKILMARAGIKPISSITHMALGSGGKEWIPTAYDEKLREELIRKQIEKIEQVSETRFRYCCVIEKDELIGQIINELALIDADGDFVCIKTFSDKGKDEDVELEFIVDDIF